MKFFTSIISLYLLSKVYSSSLLKKYGTEVIDDNDVIFESKDFDDDEEMHFKIQTNYKNIDNYKTNSINDIEYIYFSELSADLSSISHGYLNTYFLKTTEDGKLRTNYFTIKKTKRNYSPSNGNYIYMRFPNINLSNSKKATITNIEEDEGKIETWVIIVIVVVIVAIIVGIIIFCVCRRIRMKKAQQAAMAANAATIAAQNQAAANIAAQNAAYEAAAQNAYIAEQNYQAQAYQAQVYQNKNYMSPPGVVSDAGYTSNAVM
jgi:hypothetical protein